MICVCIHIYTQCWVLFTTKFAFNNDYQIIPISVKFNIMLSEDNFNPIVMTIFNENKNQEKPQNPKCLLMLIPRIHKHFVKFLQLCT